MNKHPLLFSPFTPYLWLFILTNNQIDKEFIAFRLRFANHSLRLQISAFINHGIISKSVVCGLEPPNLNYKVRGWICH